MTSVMGVIVKRDLMLAARRRIDALLPVVFFVVAVTLFPLGVGPEAQVLRQIAPGVVWVCALMASMMSVTQIYAQDHADGTLEQMLVSGQSLMQISLAKALVHWLTTGFPLMLVTPVIGLLFDVHRDAIEALFWGLLLGTPILSLLGGVGSALTLGLRSGGVLVVLLVLPLCIPALIFGAGAVGAVDSGLSASGHYSLLGALLIFSVLGAPPATAAALRISLH
ncbi:MAG: heme exporter protein CcmB [Leptothrix ochracea]|uniref:heme exporter protein CcmB n=1 Tax=Leptothrix ochracea TaxID=735331 RepID=UPI0034E2A79C